MPTADHIAARIASLERRLRFLNPYPTEAQVAALAKVLGQDMSLAYRSTIIAEAAKVGIYPTGALDPFIAATLESDVHTAARQVAETYRKRYAKAEAKGNDMAAWRAQYASGKAPQVYTFEIGGAENDARRAFYANNDQIVATAHVEPTDAAIPDVCEDWIGLGTIPVGDIPGDLPAHQNCPHEWVVDVAPTADDTSGSGGSDGSDGSADGTASGDDGGDALGTGTGTGGDAGNTTGGLPGAGTSGGSGGTGLPGAGTPGALPGEPGWLNPSPATFLTAIWLAGMIAALLDDDDDTQDTSEEDDDESQ